MDDTGQPASFAARLRQLAAERGDQAAIVFRASGDNTTLTFARFDQAAEEYARYLLQAGVGYGDYVTIAEPNCPEFLIATAACWKIGAVPQPVSARLPGLELQQIVELADSALVVGAEAPGRASTPGPRFRPPTSTSASTSTPTSADAAAEPLDDVVSPAWKAPTSGGSTGRPKLIVSGDPSLYSESLKGMGPIIGAEAGKVMVMPGPLYHNGPFIWTWQALLAGATVVLLPRFDAEATLAAVAEHQAHAIYLVPTMMQRMWKLPDEVKFSYDLSSLKVAFHLAEPCPKWLKEVWLDWIGADHLYELYGGTEGQMFTVIDGKTWRDRPGSVGKPVAGEIKIFSADGDEVPANTEGEVWMRWTDRDTPTYTYLGAEPERKEDGWECLGDMGWIDEDGYLYLADRRKDMILVGGANVYPAEVEAAIGANPEVLSSAVLGLPDEDKGARIHAIVQRRPESALTEADLLAFLAERLVGYKLPRSIEWSEEPLRDDAGKVRRAALAADRATK